MRWDGLTQPTGYATKTHIISQILLQILKQTKADGFFALTASTPLEREKNTTHL